MTRFGLSKNWAASIALVVAAIVLSPVIWRLIPLVSRLRSWSKRESDPHDGWLRAKSRQVWQAKPITMFLLLVAMLYGIMNTSFTVELATTPALVSRSTQKYVEAFVTLGGATSRPTDAKVVVSDSTGKDILSPPLIEMQPGRLHVFFATAPLPDGVYRLRLEYARPSLTGEFPFWHSPVVRRTAIVLAP